MKTSLTHSLRFLFSFLSFLIFTNIAHATLYTATSSGNWSNPATWGGVVPETELKDNQVLIPAGVSVTMDVDLFLNGTPVVLEVNGTIIAKANSIFTASWGLISGTGSIIMDNMEINGGTTMSFTGGFKVKSLTNGLPNFNVVADITVSQTLFLTEGKLTLSANGSLQMGTGADIVVSNSSIQLNGGSLLLDNPYNVNYNNASSTTGAELSGTGLNNVLINVQDSASQVILSSDLKVKGFLNLLNGNLLLNDHNLSIEGNIAAGGAGKLIATALSSVTISTKNSPLGSLTFGDNNALKSLKLNIADGGSLNIESDLVIAESLEFQKGRLDINNHKLTMDNAAVITGANIASYIITDSTGILSMHLSPGNVNKVLFPIGTLAFYSPAQLNLSANSNSGRLNVNVRQNVLQHYTTGLDLSIKQPLVDATWSLGSDTAIKNMNLTAELMWPTLAQVNGFDIKKAYESSYNGNQWDKISPVGAIAQGNGLFSIIRSNLSTLTPLAVFDANAVTAVENLYVDTNFEIYPNPTSSKLYLRNKLATENKGQIEIVNLKGQVLKKLNLSSATEPISIEELPSGIYFLKITGKGIHEAIQFVKQ